MTRTRRTTALIAAAALALGVTACSPPNENDSKETAPVTEVTPDSGFEGAGKPTGSADSSESPESPESPESGAATESAEAGENAVNGENPAVDDSTAVEGGVPGQGIEPAEPAFQ